MISDPDYADLGRRALAIVAPDEVARKEVLLSDFKRSVYSRYQPTNFQDLLDEKLTQVAHYVETGGKEGIARLMVFMPPRHGKSMTVSRLFPAWFIGRNPDKRMILASYGASLARKNGRAVRNLIKTKRYGQLFPGVKLSDDTASAMEWDIADRDGGAWAAGVGGSIIGQGAHLLLIDDPIKSRAEAESETYRENLKEWYGDAYTRLEEPGAAIILMHTRWHENDLAGYLLLAGTEDWEVLSLPAEAGANDPVGRGEGEALWPDRYSISKLRKIEATLGEYRYTAEYQQSPKPKSGGLFDTALIKIIEQPPACPEIARFYDLAITKKKRSDYTVGLKMGLTEAQDIVILDVWRRQTTAPEIQEAVVQNAHIDGRQIPIRLEAEKAGIIELAYLLQDKRLNGYAIDGATPEGDKYTRAGPVASRVKAGKMLVVRGSWNRAYLDELAMFPSGEHDDQVDATSGAYAMLADDDYAIHVGQSPDILANYRGG